MAAKRYYENHTGQFDFFNYKLIDGDEMHSMSNSQNIAPYF